MSTHTCHARGCAKSVPPRMLMCPQDWARVPRQLQAAVWATYRPGQEITKDPSPEYLEAATAAVNAVAESARLDALTDAGSRYDAAVRSVWDGIGPGLGTRQSWQLARPGMVAAQQRLDAEVAEIRAQYGTGQHEPASGAQPEPEPLSGPQQADVWADMARSHYAAGRLAEAAAYNRACSEADPSRAEHWSARAERLLTAATSRPLAEQTAVRLAAAGIGPDDPGLAHLREHNRQAAEREAGS
jgi:hypothetical protein